MLNDDMAAFGSSLSCSDHDQGSAPCIVCHQDHPLKACCRDLRLTYSADNAQGRSDPDSSVAYHELGCSKVCSLGFGLGRRQSP